LSNPDPVPLSGFLNLSAVSQQTRVPQPCFVLQPFLGCPPSELSPHRDRVPLPRPLAPSQLSTAFPEVSSDDSVHRLFPRRSHRLDAVAWFPSRLWAPFPCTSALPGPPRTRSALPQSSCFTYLGALLPL
jgi:hypothetical protein